MAGSMSEASTKKVKLCTGKRKIPKMMSAEDKKLADSLLAEVKEMRERKQRLLEQKEILEERFIKISSSSSAEISALKKKIEELKTDKKQLHEEKQNLSSSRKTESKKYRAEISHMQDEVKSLHGRNASFKFKIDITTDKINEKSAKIVDEQETAAQLQEESENFKVAMTAAISRAHTSEMQYLVKKKSLVEAQINSTMHRLTTEVLRMRQLLALASKDTLPDEDTLTKSILMWDESLTSLSNSKKNFLNEGKKFIWMISQGRPLSALPPGDVPIPDIPEICIATLLNINVLNINIQQSVAETASGVAAKNWITQPVSSVVAKAIPYPLISGTSEDDSINQEIQEFSRLFRGPHLWEDTVLTSKPDQVGKSTQVTQAAGSVKAVQTVDAADRGYAEAAREPAARGARSSRGAAKGHAARVTGSSIRYLGNISVESAELNKSFSNLTVQQSRVTAGMRPKFQNLLSQSDVSSTVTIPPKRIHPLPKLLGRGRGKCQSSSSVKEELSLFFDFIVDLYQRQLGKKHSAHDVRRALSNVRWKNNNSFTGLSTNNILERIKQQLSMQQCGNAGQQASVAPWAELTQETTLRPIGPDWQGPALGKESADDQCAICLDNLDAHRTFHLKCQHVFHEMCIKDWLKYQSNCPNCRTFAVVDEDYPPLSRG